MRDRGDPQTQGELLDWFRSAPVPMPRSQSELFRLLAMYNPRVGWDAFVEMIDFTSVTPRQICQVVHGRHSGTIDQSVPHPDYDARLHFREALVSREFRKGFLRDFLRAYQAKGRDVFIHVPKCAGTDLILNLGLRSVPLPKMLEIEGWAGDPEFVEIIAGLARAAATSERLFVYGHMELDGYIRLAGVRPHDRIFTVLRDPIDLMVSQANYVVGRLRQDPTGREPDSAEYLRLLDLTHLPEKISIGELKDLTLKALLNPLITEPNRACYYLGDGSTVAFATALENLIIHDVEITTTNYYDRWLKERWGISQSSHHNRSEPILPNIQARRLYSDVLATSTREDQKLYNLVSWALQQTGSASVTGQELARLIGPSVAEAVSRNEIPPLLTGSHQSSAEQNIHVAEKRAYVDMYLAPVSFPTSGAGRIETILAAGFGHDGDGAQYRMTGWALPEKEFTWTDGEHSTIRLPVMAGEGTFIVRLVARPFIFEQSRPFQQVELLVDDIRLGVCQVRDISVIEAEVPTDLLGQHNRLTLSLRLPTAARPSDLGDPKDRRQLALAVRSLTVLRIPPAVA